jgi:hypothetical protein
VPRAVVRAGAGEPALPRSGWRPASVIALALSALCAGLAPADGRAGDRGIHPHPYDHSAADPAAHPAETSRPAACLDALADLEAAVVALAAARPAGPAGSAVPPAAAPLADATRVKRLQARAAHACLGPGADTGQPARARVLQAPISPPPAGSSFTPPTSSRRPPGGGASSAAPMVAPRAPVPLSITACDAAGCWASDGTRLPRAGPVLLGPRGVCTQAGNLLQCP